MQLSSTSVIVIFSWWIVWRLCKPKIQNSIKFFTLLSNLIILIIIYPYLVFQPLFSVPLNAAGTCYQILHKCFVMNCYARVCAYTCTMYNVHIRIGFVMMCMSEWYFLFFYVFSAIGSIHWRGLAFVNNCIAVWFVGLIHQRKINCWNWTCKSRAWICIRVWN